MEPTLARAETRIAVGYARSNPDEPDDPEHSIEAQVERMQAYATFRGLSLETVLSDPSVPGSIPIDARPAGSELMTWVTKPRIQTVLVYHLERLFSSATECVETLQGWESEGIVLHVLDLAGSTITSNSPAGAMMMAVLRAARDMEQQSTKQAGVTNLRALHKRKRGSKILLGEKIVRGFVVPDPDEAIAVERIQQLSGQGKSLRLIAEALDQEGVPTKRRAKHWSKEAIRLILRRIDNGEIRDIRQETEQGSAPT